MCTHELRKDFVNNQEAVGSWQSSVGSNGIFFPMTFDR